VVGVSRGNEAKRNDLGERKPGAARMGGGAYTVCYVKWGRTPLFY